MKTLERIFLKTETELESKIRKIKEQIDNPPSNIHIKLIIKSMEALDNKNWNEKERIEDKIKKIEKTTSFKSEKKDSAKYNNKLFKKLFDLEEELENVRNAKMQLAFSGVLKVFLLMISISVFI